jgi:hypothetical protein
MLSKTAFISGFPMLLAIPAFCFAIIPRMTTDQCFIRPHALIIALPSSWFMISVYSISDWFMVYFFARGPSLRPMPISKATVSLRHLPPDRKMEFGIFWDFCLGIKRVPALGPCERL